MPTMTETRGSWGSWLEFLFSALGSMVGLGNIWRFPYVCYQNGGGAFLIPFFVAMLVCGCPLLFLEMLYCQYSSLGPGKVWVICPLFKGIGCGMMILTFVVSIYYTMIMGWTLYYLAMSCSAVLPWTLCPDNQTAVAACVTATNGSFHNVTATLKNTTTSEVTHLTQSYVSTEEAFWFKDVLGLSPGIEEMGSIRWPLLLCLLAAWIIVSLCLIKGIKSMGKVVYVAASAPYVILTCLLIRGCLLPGSGDGLYYYMVPAWSKLMEFEVWRSAATQVFFSIGMGFGLISTLASYNKFNNNCYRDALILPLLDCLTSVYAGMVIFAFLGYMAHISNKSIDNVVDEGPGLVFIAYPTALSTLPLPQLWSVLFFLMLFCVGLDSQFMHIQAITTALSDCFPSVLMARRTMLTFGVCLISFLLGIPLASQGGFYILNLMDWYIASVSVMLIAFVEVMVLAWVYGTDSLYDDINAMIGFRPNPVWKYAWRYFTPIFVLVLWTSGLVNFKTIGSVYRGYPPWADGIGMVIAILPVLAIPVKLVWTLLKIKGSLKQRLRQSLRPSPLWRPAVNPDVSGDLELKSLNKSKV
ncbi:unnamed protein product [Lymnaea stagnalis]|uniref:Transporter n=1 Tax=Lymnaea stagnalis TaxID=6523 RepID=A0AAV2HN79_LYMST